MKTVKLTAEAVLETKIYVAKIDQNAFTGRHHVVLEVEGERMLLSEGDDVVVTLQTDFTKSS